MQVAGAIGFSPNWNYLATAELYRQGTLKGARRMTLAQAMKEAIKRNWDVLAAVERLRAAGKRVDAAWGSVWPQLDAMFGHETIREKVADSSNGQRPWHAGTVAGQLNQFLFAEQAAATAVFDFLRAVVEFQRSSARFELFVSPNERDAWLERLEEHFQQARKAAAAQG